jgi:hypothetical protein
MLLQSIIQYPVTRYALQGDEPTTAVSVVARFRGSFDL